MTAPMTTNTRQGTALSSVRDPASWPRGPSVPPPVAGSSRSSRPSRTSAMTVGAELGGGRGRYGLGGIAAGTPLEVPHRALRADRRELVEVLGRRRRGRVPLERLGVPRVVAGHPAEA